MAIGDTINYAKYTAMVSDTWSYSSSWEDEDKTVYVSASSFVAEMKVTSVFLRTSNIYWTVYYYNGSSWIQAYTGNIWQQNSGTNTTKYYHNRASEGTTEEDQHQHHLWKFVITTDTPGSSHAYFSIWLGGLEMMTETEYNSYLKENEINGMKCSFDATGLYTDTTWVALRHPSTNKGTPISIASGTYKYICHEA